MPIGVAPFDFSSTTVESIATRYMRKRGCYVLTATVAPLRSGG
jgi:hypothetical protein